jgi:hypothetical protein
VVTSRSPRNAHDHSHVAARRGLRLRWENETVDDDPGWRLSPWQLVVLLVPVAGMAYRRRLIAREGADGLLVIRLLFLSFASSLVVFGFLVILVGDLDGTVSPNTYAAGLVPAGILTLLAPELLRRPLDCTSETSLASTYRTTFFLRIAFAESAALFGFVGTFVTGARWMYFVGAAFTAVGMARAAPTRGSFERMQAELGSAGCHRSLIAAIRGTAAPG